jgi:TPR repeat protein
VRDADPARGFDLVAAAAGQAHPSAMLEAGRMLRDGRGRTADPVEAQAWFIAGAERNAQGAAADRDALAGRLDADQQARARARAGQLVPAR